MILERSKAINLLSLLSAIDLTEADYTEKTENIMSELEVSSIDNDKLDGLVVDAFSDEITFFKNSYIEDCLVERLGRPISVFGVESNMYACPCCGYKTLSKKGEYYICKVCFWEDDGTEEDTKYSSVNRMTLGQAKETFIRIGVIKDAYLNHVDNNRQKKYPR